MLLIIGQKIFANKVVFKSSYSQLFDEQINPVLSLGKKCCFWHGVLSSVLVIFPF